MTKVISTGVEARQKLLRGANFLGDALKSTLGPHGQNFLLQKGRKTTNDGKKIAAELECEDEIEHEGLAALRTASTKMNDLLDEGTTTVVVLAQAILQKASAVMGLNKSVAGTKSPTDLLRQIEQERLEITEKLVAMATPIKTKEELVASARVSVEDETLGKMIGETQWDLGPDGVIIAEETNNRTSSIKLISGIRMDNGIGSSGIINNAEHQSLEADDIKIILTNYTLETLEPLLPILNQIIKTGSRKVAIVARAFTNQAIQDCLMNIQKGNMFYPINAPYVNQTEIMKDMEAVLGATFIDVESSRLEDIQISDVGFAHKISVRRYDSLFTGKVDDKSTERIAKRVETLQNEAKGTESEFTRKQLNQRIAQLTNGFALLEVGALSDIERGRLFDKCEDAVNAVRHAFQEGTVEGAGLAFKTISEALPDTYLLKQPLLSVYQQIMSTSPKDFIIEPWVRDPVKVLRVALEIACDVAGTLATAGGATAEARPKPLDQLLRKAQE